MSHIFGIIASDNGVPDNEVEDMLVDYCDMLDQVETKQNAAVDIDRKHGSLLSIGHLLGRCYYRKRSPNDAVVYRCVKSLIQQLDGSPNSTYYLLAGASCQSLAEVGRIRSIDSLLRLGQNIVPTEDTEMADSGKPSSPTTTPIPAPKDKAPTTKDLLDKLASLAKTSKDTKLQENAILALGHLSIPLSNDSDSELIDTIVAALFATADSKQVELYFAGGEAWTALAFGWESQALQKYKDISDMELPDTLARHHDNHGSSFQTVIETIVKNYVASDRSWFRKAACIWLLSILKFGKDQEIVKVICDASKNANLRSLTTCLTFVLEKSRNDPCFLLSPVK
jgi:proteasome component ECM29